MGEHFALERSPRDSRIEFEIHEAVSHASGPKLERGKENVEASCCLRIVSVSFGGNYGRGLATCRTGHGWSAPVFIAIDGGSVGYQIGGSSTDLVMLFMNDHALQSLLGDKFKLGADASVAAGPVGRNAAAGTDVKLAAEILSYSRTKGAFAGVSLDGAVVQADKSGDTAMYGHDVDRHEILDGKIAVPVSARPLLHEISGYAHETSAKS